MSITCEDVVAAAYQDAEILADDETPAAEQGSRGLRLLQDVYRALVTQGTLGRFTARLVTADYTAQEGDRVAYSGATSATVTLPATLEDDTSPVPYGQEQVTSTSAAVDTVNRAPRDLSVAEIAGATPQTFVYDAQVGDWINIESLTLNSTAPLTPRFRGELTALLAEKLARKPILPDLVRAAARARMTIALNASAPYTPTQAEYF